MIKIPFNKPYFSGKETTYIKDAVQKGQISGNGFYTQECQKKIQDKYGFEKCLLTTSCTSALEMSAILLNIKPGDEIILPSYTFVSVANAFLMRGATLIFADSCENSPHIDPQSINSLISPDTKAIVVVHYGGVACMMDEIMEIVEKQNLYLIEDAAHSIDSFYKGRPLGSIGHLATFSFHETKNITCGEGGMLVINDPALRDRADVIWEKGTNRKAFYNGEVRKYEWVDIGSSFLPSELQAAFLFAQLENIESIQYQRMTIWNRYYKNLISLSQEGFFKLPEVPPYSSPNGHIFYLVMKNEKARDCFISFMKSKGILAVFHYLPLHKSPYFKYKYSGDLLPFSIMYSECLVRLPLFYDLSESDQNHICTEIKSFFTFD